MGKTYINAVKYEITATFKIDGVVDKHDIIGAIFGQSEGLLGEELDLRELQKNGKIGRITISHTMQGGTTTGKVVVPSSMDMVETSILAAAVETVDKVGPCKASFVVREIQDTRAKKRDEVINRAQSLLERLMHDQIPESEEIAKKVRERVRTSEIQGYGRDSLPSGPAIDSSDSVIVVEGRADVLTMLKNSIKNVIGMDGSKISSTIVDLGKKKTITLFIDGDRGGELILRKLSALTDVDFVARAPDGKEVEELSRKEIIMSLRRKVPLTEAAEKKEQETKHGQGREPFKPAMETPRPTREPFKPAMEISKPAREPFKPAMEISKPAREPFKPRREYKKREPFQRPRRFEKRASFSAKEEAVEKPKPLSKADVDEIEKLRPVMESLKGSLKAKIFDDKMKELEEASVRDLLKSLKKHKNADTVVLDGIITKRLLEACEENGVKKLVGAKAGKIAESEKTKAIVIN